MASTNISFDSIPASIRKPGKYFEYNTRLAVRTLPNNRQKVLLIGAGNQAATVMANTPQRVFSSAEAATMFGSGSQLARMCRSAITANPYLDLSAVMLYEYAGTKAFSTLTITGERATSHGTIVVLLGGVEHTAFILQNDSNAVITSKVFSALADATLVDVHWWHGDSTYATLFISAKSVGAAGNDITLLVTDTITGITTTAGETPVLTGGTDAVTDSLDLALAAVAKEEYQVYVSPHIDSTNLGALKTHLDTLAGPLEARPAIGIFATTGSLTEATDLAFALNAGRLYGALLRGTTTPSEEVAAAFAAMAAFEEDPARPLNTLPLTGVSPPPIAQRLSRTEQEACLNGGGVTPLEVGPGEVVQIVRAVSTYTRDPQGVDDISLLDLSTIRTLDYVRKAIRERISLRFPREKLSARTPDRVRSEILDVLVKLEELEIVENVAANKNGVLVERDLQDPNRLDAKIPTDVVNGLHIFAGRIDLIL